MFSMVIGIMSCGEDEENISQNPTSNPGLIEPTTQVEPEPGDDTPWEIVWVRIDPATGQETYISEHIYTYDILEQQNILAAKVLDKEGRPVPNAESSGHFLTHLTWLAILSKRMTQVFRKQHHKSRWIINLRLLSPTQWVTIHGKWSSSALLKFHLLKAVIIA
jgi:hypothetical protein